MERHVFPSGYPTTAATLQWMARVVRDRESHPRIRARARQITADVDQLDVDGEIKAVWDWVTSHVRYLRDPLHTEHLTDPVELDEQIDDGDAAEDCEGIALYAATLLAAMGIASVFEAQGQDAAQPDRFTHCALLALNSRTHRAVSFDPVGALEFENFGLGDTVHRPGDPVERWTLEGRRLDGGKEKTMRRRSRKSFARLAFGDAGDDSLFDPSDLDSSPPTPTIEDGTITTSSSSQFVDDGSDPKSIADSSTDGSSSSKGSKGSSSSSSSGSRKSSGSGSSSSKGTSKPPVANSGSGGGGDSSGDGMSLIDDLFKAGASIADQFGPTGKIIGGVLHTADGVFDAATGRKIGTAVNIAADGTVTKKVIPAPAARNKLLRAIGPVTATTGKGKGKGKSGADAGAGTAAPVSGATVAIGAGVGWAIAKALALI